jgi:hypothetical protein
MKIKTLLFAPLLLLTLTTQGCDDVDLELLAKTLDGIATANETMLNVVLTAEESKFISTEEARPFVSASLRIGIAGREAVAVTKAIVEMEAEDRTNLFEILDPIMEAIDNIVESEDLTGIKNEEVRRSLQLALLAIRSTISTARILLEE